MSENTGKFRFAIQALLFLVLASGCVALYLFLANQRQSKSNSAIISENADSASITRWDVVPNGDRSLAYNVFKDSGIWKIRLHDNVIVDADLNIVKRSLKHLSKLASAEHVHLAKSKWKDEGLDNSGTMVTVYEGERVTGSYIIGKIGFIDQYKSSYYFKPVQSDSVYRLTEVYLDGSAIAKEENFRKRTFVPVAPVYYKQVRIVSADTNVYYLLENIKGKWSISGRDIDQNKVLTYLKMLSLIHVPTFTSELVKTPPEASVLIDTKYGPITLIASKTHDGNWVMASSVNIGNRVELTLPQVNAIFPPFHYFMP